MGNSLNYTEKRAERRKRVGVRHWIYGIMACLCCIAFAIWTGYYGVLILIPVFIDIYITKYIPWGGWRNVENKYLRVVLDWVDAIVFALVGVWIITTFFFQNYQIPSSSLEKTLLVGDFLCVSKMSYGTRSPMTPLSLPLMLHTIPVLNTKSYLDKPQLDYQRFRSGGQVQRYDIVVFNFPAGDTVPLKVTNPDYYILSKEYGRDEIWRNKEQFGEVVYRPVDRRENYVKRCVGLPGDTLQIIDDTTYIDGKPLANPEMMQLKYVVQTTELISPKVWDDLEISLEDRVASLDFNMSQFDSLQCRFLGLSYMPDRETFLYSNVFMTVEMVEKLAKKGFVLNIQKQNFFYKQLRKMDSVTFRSYRFVQPFVFPVTYWDYAEAGDFPATWIPERGATLTFDTDVERKVATYRQCIVNYEGNTLDFRDGRVYINGEQADSYTFGFDYYFMMGDNRDNSMDSRAWGFVPEDHIVGRPLFIWLSLNKDKGWFSGKIRWNRIFTRGNRNT